MKTENIELINGNFSPQEAKEILLTILEDKIRFHNVKMMRGYETGADTSASKKRLSELKTSKEKVLRFVDEALASSKDLTINATISIGTSVHKKVGQTAD